MERELKMMQDEYDKAGAKVISSFGQMTMAEDNLIRAVCEERNAKAQLDKANVEWKQENDKCGKAKAKLEEAKARAALVERDEARQEQDMARKGCRRLRERGDALEAQLEDERSLRREMRISNEKSWRDSNAGALSVSSSSRN
jgi:hypothetical protein